MCKKRFAFTEKRFAFFVKSDLLFPKNDLPFSKNDLLFVYFLYKKEQACFDLLFWITFYSVLLPGSDDLTVAECLLCFLSLLCCRSYRFLSSPAAYGFFLSSLVFSCPLPSSPKKRFAFDISLIQPFQNCF